MVPPPWHCSSATVLTQSRLLGEVRQGARQAKDLRKCQFFEIKSLFLQGHTEGYTSRRITYTNGHLIAGDTVHDIVLYYHRRSPSPINNTSLFHDRLYCGYHPRHRVVKHSLGHQYPYTDTTYDWLLCYATPPRCSRTAGGSHDLRTLSICTRVSTVTSFAKNLSAVASTPPTCSSTPFAGKPRMCPPC